jgi:ribosomal protein L32
MDLLFILYCFLFILIIVAPSALIYWKYNENGESLFGASPDEELSNLQEEKQILLSNLGDLKAEEETGKLKNGEFQNLSLELLESLSDIDYQISQKQQKNAQTKVIQSNIEICPNCGTKFIAQAKFCHSCGYKITV